MSHLRHFWHINALVHVWDSLTTLQNHTWLEKVISDVSHGNFIKTHTGAQPQRLSVCLSRNCQKQAIHTKRLFHLITHNPLHSYSTPKIKVNTTEVPVSIFLLSYLLNDTHTSVLRPHTMKPSVFLFSSVCSHIITCVCFVCTYVHVMPYMQIKQC